MADLVNFDMDATELVRKSEKFDKHLAYAVVDGINETVKLIQKVEQERADQKLKLRRGDFIKRRIAVIKPFASVSQGRPYAEIGINSGRSKGKGTLILGKLEIGGTKEPSAGASANAIPITGSAARPQFGQEVANKLLFQNMGLKRHITTSPMSAKHPRKSWVYKQNGVKVTSQGGKKQLKGNDRTFVIPKVGVFQRVGSKRNQIALIWKFKRGGVAILSRLGWSVTARGTADKYLSDTIRYHMRRKGLLE